MPPWMALASTPYTNVQGANKQQATLAFYVALMQHLQGTHERSYLLQDTKLFSGYRIRIECEAAGGGRSMLVTLR
jgi:hypothetical protein